MRCVGHRGDSSHIVQLAVGCVTEVGEARIFEISSRKRSAEGHLHRVG